MNWLSDSVSQDNIEETSRLDKNSSYTALYRYLIASYEFDLCLPGEFHSGLGHAPTTGLGTVFEV